MFAIMVAATERGFKPDEVKWLARVAHPQATKAEIRDAYVAAIEWFRDAAAAREWLANHLERFGLSLRERN
jgi:hypothetical protein